MGRQTVRFRLKYLTEDTDRHGNVRLYFRKRGAPRKLRLAGPLGSDAFWKDYNAALRGETPPSHRDKTDTAEPAPQAADPGTFAWLVDTYKKSAAFADLDPRTRYVREGLYLRLVKADGEKPFRMMQPRHVRRIRDDHAATPGTANAFIKALRQLFSWAVEQELMETNPARDVPYKRPKNPDGFQAWSIDEIEAFEKTHPIGSTARLAFALLFYLDLRRADAVQLGPQHLRHGRFEYTQNKGRNRKPVRISVRAPAALLAIIDATPVGDLTYLVSEWKRPFSHAGFGNRFRKWCNEAGLKDRSAHGLRKSRLVLGAELGLTPHHLQGVSGHTTLKETARYTADANRKTLADEAMTTFDAYDLQRLNAESVPLTQNMQKSGTQKPSK